MKKKYIMPIVGVCEMEAEDIICGSGGSSEKLTTNPTTPPSPTNGVITTESKSIFVEEDDCEVEW